ncbi:hypothetical protein [Acidicapsa acidisoli]|uniref:hypothetical protein n=1 Tax=Acidicapsa acidisoli TaxID=1615681 RepID=UPI0021E044E4|nr:hypothetical protein [Acidicapsa acidisoli]
MRNWRWNLGFLAVSVLAIVCISQAQNAGTTKTIEKPAKPLDAFAWLVGGVWTADATAFGPEMLRIETSYSPSDNGSYLRFTTHFVSTHGILKNYDGNMYWDAARHQLRMWYMSASGQITECPMTIEGNLWRMEFEGTNFDDKPAVLQVLVERKTNDLYHWSLAEKAGESWKPLAGLDYARK